MLSLLLWCVFGLILYPSKDWLFLVMTASVIFGLVLGLLLLVSRSLKLFFAIGKASSSKIRSKLEKLRVSGVKCTIISGVTSPTKNYQYLSFNLVLHLLQIWFLSSASGVDTILANLALSPLAILSRLAATDVCWCWHRDAALIAFTNRISLQLLPWVCFVPHAIYYQQLVYFSGTISTNTSVLWLIFFIVKFYAESIQILLQNQFIKRNRVLYFLIKDYHL